MAGGVEQLLVELGVGQGDLVDGEAVASQGRQRCHGGGGGVGVVEWGFGQVVRCVGVGVGDHVQVLGWDVVGVFRFDVGAVRVACGVGVVEVVGVGRVVRDGVGQGERPVDEGVGEGVVGEGFTVGSVGDAQEIPEWDAVFGGAGDGGDDGGPAGVGEEGAGGLVAECAGQLGEPVGLQGVRRRGVPVGGEDRGGNVPGDPPPQSGGLVLVGQRPFGGGAPDQGGGVGAGPGERGEVLSEGRPVRVASWGESDLDG